MRGEINNGRMPSEKRLDCIETRLTVIETRLGMIGLAMPLAIAVTAIIVGVLVKA